ncbi:hypothetical protein BS47DRAFT_1354483, partial [Hydnum rufescens UP504]
MPKHHHRPSTGKSPPKETAPVVPDAADDSEGSQPYAPLDATTVASLLQGALLLLQTVELSPEHANMIWLLHSSAFDKTPEYRARTTQAFLTYQQKDHASHVNAVLTLTNTNAELVKQNILLTDTIIASNVNPTPKANSVNIAQPIPASVVADVPAHPTHSTWTQSKHPKPITPTRRSSKPLFPVRTPQSPTRRNHPSRLNIQIWPPIPPDERLMGQTVVDKVNHTLQAAHAPNNIAIMSVLYSIAGNPIAIARPSCTANDLHPYATLIAKTLFPRFEKAQGCPDSQYFRVKLDHVPLTRDDGSQISPTEVEHEIAANFAEFPSFVRPLPARWLVSENRIPRPLSASVVLTFAHQPDAQRFFNAHTIFVLGFPCKTSRYEERAPKRDSKIALTQPNDHPLPCRSLADNDIEVDDDNIRDLPPLLRSERKRKLSGNEETVRQRPPLGT